MASQAISREVCMGFLLSLSFAWVPVGHKQMLLFMITHFRLSLHFIRDTEENIFSVGP